MPNARNVKELIVGADGRDRAWAYDGERWIVVLRDDEDRPSFCFAVAHEAECRRICDACHNAHRADDTKFSVSYFVAATVAATIRLSRNYGVNGSAGRARSQASLKRVMRATLLAEGHALPPRLSLRALHALQKDIWAEMDMWDRVAALPGMMATEAAAQAASSQPVRPQP